MSGFAAAAASACNSGWQRTPANNTDANSFYRYETGANAHPSYAPTGSSAEIWSTNPTIACPNACGQVASAWVGIGAYDNRFNAIIIQNGEFKENGGSPVPFYEVNVEPACGPSGCPAGYNAFFATGGTLNLGVYYEYDNEYDSDDTVHLNFAGVNKYNFDLSSQCHSGDCQGVPTGGNWAPEAKGETTSYSTQMPGTSGNNENWATLELRHGSPSVWDNSATQNWSGSGFPQGDEVNGVTHTELLASFKNTTTTIQGYPVITAYDACTTH